MKKSAKILFSAAVLFFACSQLVLAEELPAAEEAAVIEEQATVAQSAAPEAAAAEEKKPSCLKGIEILTGYGVGKLRVGQGTFHAAPVFVDLDFDIKGIFEKIHLASPGLMEFVVEPFATYIVDPKSNAEIGTNFLIKVGILPETAKFQPYFKGGVGMLYMSLHTVEQSTQFNFNEYAGLGMHYFFKKDMAFTLEYRFRHVSNAGIDSPNTGLNTNFAICGVSFRY